MNIVNLQPIKPDFFLRPADAVAQDLIGAILLIDGVGGKIVDTEAYDQYADIAAHCYNWKEPDEPWKTPLNKSMYLEGGHAYVCPGRQLLHLNFVCDKFNIASAVLINAIEPLNTPENIAAMMKRRSPNFKTMPTVRQLCAGPGALGEALGISCDLDGKSLFASPFRLFSRQDEVFVAHGPRIGVTRNNLKRRFYLQENAYIRKTKAIPRS